MKLDGVQSKQLLPRFADDMEWIQQAFDVIVKHANERAKSIDAPLSMEAIQALTDEELQALYEQYGIAIYYPDLSRETREKMLFEMCRIYRYLGTPKAIETLCNYIFDGVELNVKVVDNQAFDENGRLVNPSMLDTFDIEIDPQIPVLDANAHARLLDNIIHFSRNSQGLNGINYDFPENFDLSVALGVSGANPVCIVDYINDAICEPVPIPPQPDETPKGYIVVDSTGTIQHSIDLDDMFIHQIQHSVDVVNFYFTPNGAAETENSELESGVDVTLYNADGTVADDDLYDGSGTLTYTQANGNMFEADGGDLISLQSGALVMNPNADYKALSVQVEEYDPTTLDMILGLKWDKDNNEWKTVAFNQEPSDNFWWNGLLSEDDKAKVTKFGLSTALDNPQYNSFGNIGAIVWDRRYTFDVLDLYSDLGQTSVPGYDLSNLRTSYLWVNGSDILNIWSDVQDSTPVKAWKCRIKKLPSLEIVVGVRWDSGVNNWIAPSFSAPDWFYAGILDPADITTLANFGLNVSTEPGNAGPNGNILYSNGYYYDILELYSDLGSTISPYTNMSNLTMVSQSFSLGDILSIKNVSAINSGLIMSYKLRITHKPYIEVLLGLRWRSDHWGAENFDYGSGNYWYGGILSAEDQQRLIDFGCVISKQGTQQVGQFGQITYDNANFSYEPIAFYADQAGTIENSFDISQFYCTQYSPGWFTVWCNTRYQATSIVWRCRITKLNP